ncbi:MAG: hypothetical protein ACXVA2_05935 [Mucilaginibacter sp.]
MPRVGGAGGGGILNLNNDALRLYLYARIKPEIWDAVVPMGPKYSEGTLNVVAAQVIKTISHHTREAGLKDELNEIGEKLFSSGSSQMSYSEDDWRCGNVPLPIPHFGFAGVFSIADEVELNPQPLPPRYFGAILSLVAESVSDTRIAATLKGIAAKQLG